MLVDVEVAPADLMRDLNRKTGLCEFGDGASDFVFEGILPEFGRCAVAQGRSE